MEEILMDRKSAPRDEPKPPPNPSRIEGEPAPSRKHQKEQPHFPENEGLAGRKSRPAIDIEGGEGAELEKERQVAAQRGRVT